MTKPNIEAENEIRFEDLMTKESQQTTENTSPSTKSAINQTPNEDELFGSVDNVEFKPEIRNLSSTKESQTRRREEEPFLVTTSGEIAISD